MKKTGNILCYGFILLLLLADIAVLAYFFNFSAAPGYYYICLACIFVVLILFLIFQLKVQKRLKASIRPWIPVGFTILVLLFSGIFLYTGVRDGLAMNHPLQTTVNQTKFFRIPHTIFKYSLKDTYRMEGIDILDEKVSLQISEKDYKKYSYITEKEYMEYDEDSDRILYSYEYSEDSKLMAEYLPVSKKVVNLVELTPSSKTYTQTDKLHSLEAEITSVIDDRTMEATVTDLGDYEGSHVKEGDTITIHGTMTILYPYNVQGFYEIKEGDLVTFSVDELTTGDSISVTTSVLNLAENQTKGEPVE